MNNNSNSNSTSQARECVPGCACGESGFAELYPLELTAADLYLCRKAPACVHAVNFESRVYCSCPLRLELAVTLHASSRPELTAKPDER